MPHPIIKVDELLRLVIDELVEISPRTVVSFALTCRSLEEPALSSLWREQWTLIELAKVLPQHTWIKNEGDSFRRIIVIGCDLLLGYTLYKFL